MEETPTFSGQVAYPTPDRIIVKMDAKETKTASGIYIPTTSHSTHVQKGVIVSVSESESYYKKGMNVVMGKNEGQVIDMDDTSAEYRLYGTKDVRLILL